MFFTFFKGEFRAATLYDLVLPFIIIWNIQDKIFDKENEMTPDQLLKAKRMVSIQKLSMFIDGFNFSPVKIDKILHKNNSIDMTNIMTSNTRSSLAAGQTAMGWH